MRNLFRSCIDNFIHQAEVLTWGMKVSLNLENGLNFDRSVLELKVIEETFEDIGGTIIGPEIRSKRVVFEVGEEAVSINKAHKSNLANKI